MIDEMWLHVIKKIVRKYKLFWFYIADIRWIMIIPFFLICSASLFAVGACENM